MARIDWPDFKERFARLREAVELLRRLWAEDRVTFDGTYFQTDGATVYDRPKHGVPIYIAAGGPLVSKYAGRVADGFICTSGKGMDLYTEKLLPAVDEGLGGSGRAPDAVSRMIEIKLSYDRDPAAALDNTRFWAPLALTAEQKHSLADPTEMEAAGDALPIEQVASRWIVTSDPDEAATAVKVYVDAGFDHLVFHGPGHDQRRFLETFAREGRPAARAFTGWLRTVRAKHWANSAVHEDMLSTRSAIRRPSPTG